MKALVLHWSAGGNTQKVALRLAQTLEGEGVAVDVQRIDGELAVQYYDYQLVFIGAPVYQFLPPDAVMGFLKRQNRDAVEPAAPERPGVLGVVFCTYGGPHTGTREAVPALRYMGQFLEHAGIRVVDEWAVVGEFHDQGRQRLNVEGRLGDISGRPNESDLRDVAERARGLLRRVRFLLPG